MPRYEDITEQLPSIYRPSYFYGFIRLGNCIPKNIRSEKKVDKITDTRLFVKELSARRYASPFDVSSVL